MHENVCIDDSEREAETAGRKKTSGISRLGGHPAQEGNEIMSIDTVKAIADYFGVSVDSLLQEPQKKRKGS